MEASGQLETPAASPVGKQPPGTGIHWIGGCVGPTAGLNAVEKGKFFLQTPGI
jgi:hypothetical protein